MTSRQMITAKTYDKRGRVISVAVNDYTKTHPLQSKLAAEVDREHKIFLRAEISALIKARGRPVDMITVERRMRDGSFGTAKPCPICQRAIEFFGVRKVVHT